jgi:hypothetical protein
MHVPAKSLTVAVCAIGLAIGAWLLWPVAASAQFNIPGIVFGAMNQHYNYGSGAYRGHHRRVHETKHERRHKGDTEDAEQGTNGKPDPVPDNKSVAAAPDKKSAPVENKPADTASTNKPAETASAGAPPSGGTPASTGAAASTGAPAATNNDQPTFSPSR